MRLMYGGLQIADENWARFVWGYDLLKNRAGIGYGVLGRVSCSELGIAVAGQADAAAKMAAIDTALAQQPRDLLFLNDNGSPSANSVTTGSTLSGVRCTGWQWSDKPGAQFQTWRQYSAEFEWETCFAGAAALLIDFAETVVTSGGTPVLAELVPINAPAVVQLAAPQTAYRAVQQGRAVGYLARPPAPPPIWPAALHAQQVGTASGERVGVNYKDFVRTWRYDFVSETPLVGLPNEWVG